MVAHLFELITETVTGFFEVINTSLSDIVSLLYKSGESGGFTLVGTLVLIPLGVGLVWYLIRFITNLVRNATR